MRGGSANGHGEIPNPALNVEGETQAVWLVPLSGGAPRRVGEGHSPAVAGDRIAFVKGGEIWGASLRDTAAATQLMHTRGRAGDLRWSPKGDKLAFTSDRGDHSFIGVYDASAKTLDVSLAIGRRGRLTDLVARWHARRLHPHRDHLAAAIVRRGSNGGAVVDRRRRCRDGRRDTRSGRRSPESAARSTGSSSDAQLMWGQGDRIVFPWERDGYEHLYAVSASGGDATLLTPGDFEVEHVSIAPDRATIFYSSNQGDIDRRHIWRVGVAGGKPAAVTSGVGLEWSPVQTSDGKAIAMLRSDVKIPARPAIVRRLRGAARHCARAHSGIAFRRARS